LNSAVVIIVFNRPELTQRLWNVLEEIKPSKLYVIADGPRNSEEAKLVDEVREITDAPSWDVELHKIYADENMGLRLRIISGLNQVFEHEESAMILEDECIPHPTFFSFCEDLLQAYQDVPNVMTISGSNLLKGSINIPESYYFSKYMLCWGWATWRRAWHSFDGAMEDLEELEKNDWLSDWLPDSKAEKFWNSLFLRVKSGEINSWAISWIYSIWKVGGFNIHPRCNLVNNLGIYEGGVHSDAKNRVFDGLETEQMTPPWVGPKSRLPNAGADRFLENTYYSKYLQSAQSPCSLYRRLLTALKKI